MNDVTLMSESDARAVIARMRKLRKRARWVGLSYSDIESVDEALLVKLAVSGWDVIADEAEATFDRHRECNSPVNAGLCICARPWPCAEVEAEFRRLAPYRSLIEGENGA